MEIKDLAEKYNLDKAVDFWKHKQSGKWIITHDACEKIASIEGIILAKWETLNSERDFCRFLITMAMPMKDSAEKLIASIGEASKENCQSRYYGSMAEKRGVDRCILKLINAYEYGIYSDSEADSFKKPVASKEDVGEIKVAPRPITNKQMNLIIQLELKANVKHHIEFKGLGTQQASDYIDKLDNIIKENQNG